MNTEQFIRKSTARGLSRRAAIQALGLNRWKSDLIIGVMGPIEWVKNGTTFGNRLAYEASCGKFTLAQVVTLGHTRERWSESRRLTVDGATRIIAELVEHFQSPVHITTIRRRVTAGMSLRDALITPRQQPEPGRWDPWKRSRQQVAPHLGEQIPELIKDLDSSTLC